MTPPRFRLGLTAILLLAAALRGIYPTADPPWRSTVGVVWHDEGAWTHNARNKALYGAWRQDDWNPVYIAPVFTGLEYASFAAFGVGLRQARLVSEAAGVLSVLLLALGVRRVGGPVAGLLAAALAASNFVYVMYDRAALMEALMAALIVASWYCSTRAEREPAWGAGAGLFAALAFFTKAAAAFYVGALVLAAAIAAVRGSPTARRLSLWTVGGVMLAFGAVAAAFVLPHWTDYRFYNWQISVTRKPSYDMASLAMRASWFPVVNDTFSRMWGALCLGLFGAWGIALRWRRATHAEWLLLLWVVVGTLELLVHDVGNERRYVFLIPALVALASLVLARGSLLPADLSPPGRAAVLLAAPLVVYTAYVLLGPLVRLAYLGDIHAGVFRLPVRISAALALAVTVALLASGPPLAPAQRLRWGRRTAVFLGAAGLLWNVAQFALWAKDRTAKNYAASVALGQVLAPGTLVQGKLANGLALDNRIRPLFIGHGFGNYAERKNRRDVRYILTYSDPEIGHEGDQIVDVLAAYPGWRIIMTFPVAETPSGHDQAALIEKRARD